MVPIRTPVTYIKQPGFHIICLFAGHSIKAGAASVLSSVYTLFIFNNTCAENRLR